MTKRPSARILNALRSASACLRANRHRRAQQLLGELILAHPNLVEARWLLANSFFEIQDFVRAREELRVCIRLAPTKPEPYALLARMLALNGQSGEAKQLLQQALRLDPDNPGAACALARILLVEGGAAEACTLIEPYTRKCAANTEIPGLYGHALMALGRKGEAAAAFRKIVLAEPDNPDARFRLAAVLADSDRPLEAEAEVRAGVATGGKTADAAFVLARALMGQTRFAEAESELRQVVRSRPHHVTAQANLSELVWMRSGEVGEASAELDAALHGKPRLSTLRIIKARVLLAAQRSEQALAVIEAGLALAGSDLSLLNAAAEIALSLDPAHALEYAQRALHVAPADHSALLAFGKASLGAGAARQALEAAEKLHRLDAADGQALSLQADSLRMLGDPGYTVLADYTHLVRAEIIDTPAGWPDLSAYLADLARALEQAHTLKAHPIGQSLRGGSQVELAPERSSDAAVEAFPQAIDGPIRRYLKAIGKGDDPLRCRNTGRYRLRSAWSVRLRPNGFHVNHFHPQGWLSSACYIRLPLAVENHAGEGWLQFGEPAFPTVPSLEAEYFLKPAPGLLALFPSYMWHGTVPFSGDPTDTRLTIAFDVMPS